MCKPIVVFLLAFFALQNVNANDSIFNTIFLKVATELTHTDPERAIHISDSLFNHSTDKRHKLSALMLTANTYYRIGDLKQSFKYAQQADTIAIAIKDYDWQIRIHGFYSTIYRDVRFIDEGLRHLEYVDALLPKLKDKGKRNVIKILNLQSKAYFHLLNGDYDAVINELNQGLILYPELENSSVGPYHIANSEEFRGRMYLLKNDYIQSAEAYQNALVALRKIDLEETYPVYGYIYSGIGKLQIEKGLYEEAKVYFDKAEKIVDINKSIDLKLFHKKYLKSYYSQMEDWESYAVTTDSIKVLEKTVEKEVDALLMNLFGEIRKESDTNLTKEKYYKGFIITIIGILFILLLFIYNRKKRHRLEVETILEQIETFKVAKPSPVKRSELAMEKSEVAKLNISEDTLQRIKEGLIEFEKEKLFLDPSISAVSLASYCQTNIRYISEIIKTHKNENVSAYINRLRITYMLSKLKHDKTYRTYKISHLADEAGFSSHSKFSSEFKRIVGIAPSIFISRMSK